MICMEDFGIHRMILGGSVGDAGILSGRKFILFRRFDLGIHLELHAILLNTVSTTSLQFDPLICFFFLWCDQHKCGEMADGGKL